MVRLTMENPDGHEPKGLQDGKKTLISCSNCKKHLVELWVTRPNEETEWTVARIKCPYCGDFSFEKTVKGGIHIGCTKDCSYSDIDYEGGKILVEVMKGGVKDEE